MKYNGEVCEIKDVGNEVEIAIINIRRKGCAAWREYGPAIRIRLPHAMAKGFWLQRRITLNIEAR